MEPHGGMEWKATETYAQATSAAEPTISISEFALLDVNGDGVVDSEVREAEQEHDPMMGAPACTRPMIGPPLPLYEERHDEVKVLERAEDETIGDRVQRLIDTRAVQNELGRETRLLRAKGTCCWLCRRVATDLAYCAEESHEMLLAWVCPNAFKARSLPEQRVSCLVCMNPLYWLGWLAGFCCICPGLWFHAIFAQDGRVREDETHCEREVRVHWVYGCDGPMFLELLYELVSLTVNIYNLHSKEAVTNLIALGVAGSYLLGNVLFLQAIKLRRVLEVRMCIMSSLAFGIGLSVALSISLYRGPRGLPDYRHNGTKYESIISTTYVHYGANETSTEDIERHVPGISWLLKFVVVGFMYMSVFCYRRLWNLYEPPPEEHPDDNCCQKFVRFLRSGARKVFRALATLMAMIWVWALLGLGFFLGGEDVWKALG